MKRFFILMFGVILMTPSLYSQTLPPWVEDFDGNVSFTATPSGSWVANTVYYLPGSSATNPKSYLGLVPSRIGDMTELQTPVYDCRNYDFVLLKFSHICKVSPLDIVRIEYRTDAGNVMGKWDSIPVDSYLGADPFFHARGFNAASYPEWKADDSLAFPSQSWWKEESFDLKGIANRSQVQFRFIIKHGQTIGTDVSYGWLIDNVQLLAATHQLYSPLVEFVSPFVMDTVYGVGPYEINVKVKASTNAPIQTPWLKYTATYNGVPIVDSVIMTAVSGDSLWKAAVPQFSVGTEVHYSVIGQDTLGNQATITSDYIIAMGYDETFILQDGSISYTYQFPFLPNWGYSRSMALYPAAEMDKPIQGEIYTIALRLHSATNGGFPMKIWLKTIPASQTTWTTADNKDWAILTQGATLVYDGNFHFAHTGWCDIVLDNTFNYNGTDNLVVMFEQNCGGSGCSGWMTLNPYYYVSGSALNTMWRKFSDRNLPTVSSLYDITESRPDLRIKFTPAIQSYSVAVHSIDVDETMIVSSSSNIPIVATIKNKGNTSLDSVSVSYSVNDSTPVQKTIFFNPALSWDFNYQDTLGYYHPKISGYDTISVWVTMPLDNETWDDTITKIIYGSTDIAARFVNIPPDTVYSTGYYQITAEIFTFSGTSTGVIPLYITSVLKGITTCDTVLMENTSGNLWTATMPQKAFGSAVTYSIKLTDFLSNDMEIKGSYYIKQINCVGSSSNYGGYVILQDGSTGIGGGPPFLHGWGYSRSMSLYTAAEIDNAATGFISKIALRVSMAGSGAFPMKIWLKTVPASKTTWNSATDNLDWSVLTQDATLVYDSLFHFNTLGWMDIPLTTPYLYLHTGNLVVMLEQNCGSNSCSSSGHMAISSEYYFSTTATNTYWCKAADNTPPALGATLTISETRPDLRIDVISLCSDSNSVALTSIDSPGKLGAIDGVSTPVRVRVQNKGTEYLTSCILNWTLNGESKPPVTYTGTGNLSKEFTDTITIGSYTPKADKQDTIVVWVSKPNGKTDLTTNDDTLELTIIGCASTLSGTVTVGQGKEFNSINNALSTIRDCGITGDVTLELTGIFDENVNLVGLADYMKGYTLTITSANNDVNNAVIQPSSGAGITLSDMRDLTVKTITVKAAIGNSAILFTGPCTNIAVRDCKLQVDTATSNSATFPVHKTQNTGIADSIFFIHNILNGGYSGFDFYGGIGTGTGQYATNIVFDSNTVTNQYFYGIAPNTVSFLSCSYNTVISRSANTNSSWSAIRMYYSNGPVIGNRIMQRSMAITQPDGIVSQYHNYYPAASIQSRATIANNEIILTTPGNGVYVYYSKSDIVHNSIYISGTGAAKGIYISNTGANSIDIKNNNIVLTSSLAYPIYFSATGVLNLYNIDYNNLYAPAYIGYYGVNITNMTAWKRTIPTDVHSVSILPNFADQSTHLKLTNYEGLFCDKIPSVNEDIDQTYRANTTIMGAYTIPAATQDLMLLRIVPWNATVINNQTVQVNIDVLNTGTVPVTGATLGWSLNGQTQPSVSWTATSPLAFFQETNLSLGTFQVINADTFDVVIWIDTVNGQPEIETWNDTVSATTVRAPLAEFVEPFVADSIYKLHFDVFAKIATVTGAPLTPPQLHLETIIHGTHFIYDSVPMVLNNGIWQATVPQQYDESKVIYSLTVSDNLGNVFTVTDSVYIKLFDLEDVNPVIIGTEEITNYFTPICMFDNYSWSRQIYLYKEVCPNLSPVGTYITKIAWESISATAVYTNQTCYVRAIDDTIETTNYLNPLTTGVTQVWSGTLNIIPGWVEITLNTPFFLPANKNLEVIWHNQHGAFVGVHHYAHSTTPYPMTVYANGNAAVPTTGGTPSVYRPNIRITKKDTLELYSGNNLKLASFLSPLNTVGNLCDASYLPVTVTMKNLGSNDYDFSKDTVALRLEVIDPQQTKYTAYIPLKTGILRSGMTETIELMSALPVIYSGQYELKAWLISPVDNITYDDTVFYSYLSGRIGLPVDEDFSNSKLSSIFLTTPLLGSEVWMPYTDSTSKLLPPSGKGMLRYVGTHGSITQLSIRQLDLHGSIDPKMEFWYYHDTTASVLDNSYTEVSIVVDGTPITVLTLFRKGSLHGWQQYTVDLKAYTTAQCVALQFVSMNKYGLQSAQYISHVTITSMPDLAVVKILVTPELSVCNLTNKQLDIVLQTVTNQAIDFSQYPTGLSIEIQGNYINTVSLQDVIQGNSIDTVSVFTNVDLTDVTDVKVYLASPVDNYPANDTATLSIDIKPDLSVKVNTLTGSNACLKKGMQVQQEVVIENTGNVYLPGIELMLRITGDNSTETVKETGSIDLAAGDSMTYTFTNPYTVPEEVRYQVQVTAYLGCDSAKVNAANATEECVDMRNLFIVNVDNPSLDSIGIRGSSESITVSIRNNDDLNAFNNVSVFASIETEQGQALFSRFESVPVIGSSSTVQFTFSEKYIVPNDSIYRIRVYLNSVDDYPEDDTLTVSRTTRKKANDDDNIVTSATNGFTLGQNIPNPATNSTRIDYAIPEAGQVIFHVHTISGQLLYSKTIESPSGTNSLELNTSAFAAGVYYYSIEYKGQKRVKQLGIVK